MGRKLNCKRCGCARGIMVPKLSVRLQGENGLECETEYKDLCVSCAKRVVEEIVITVCARR